MGFLALDRQLFGPRQSPRGSDGDGTTGNARCQCVVMDPVVLTEPLQMSARWSWIFVALLFPALPVAFAAWWLLTALKFEAQRRAVVAPPPGYRLVEGTICRERKRRAPAIAVSFELKLKFFKCHRGFSPSAHTVSVNPFTIETKDRTRIDVRPTEDSVALHAPVEGTESLRSSQVAAGDVVWIYGHADSIGPDARDPRRSPPGSRLWVSTVPIAGVFRAARNRCLWLAAAVLGFLLVVELAVFGGYLDILRAGEPAVGYVIDTGVESYKRRERSGSDYWAVEHLVTVEANGRKKDFEVTAASWPTGVAETPVYILLSPTTMMLGPEPHTNIDRCAVMLGLMFFGLSGFIFAGVNGRRPWYSTKRGWHARDLPPPAEQNSGGSGQGAPAERLD